MNTANIEWTVQQVNAKADWLAECMPRHLDPKDFMASATQMIRTQTKKDGSLAFAGCDLAVLLGELRKGARDGFTFGTGDAYMAVYGITPSYGVAAQGLLRKIRNSGEIGSIHADVVYKDDEFQYWKDEKGPHIKHMPNLTVQQDDRNITHAYCTLVSRDGFPYVSVFSKVQIDQRRKCSRRQELWSGWYREMCIKTVVRDISKVAPMSSDMNNFVRMDDEDIDPGKAPEVVPPSEPKQEQAPSRMHAAIAQTPIDPPPTTQTEPVTKEEIVGGLPAGVAPEPIVVPEEGPGGLPPLPPECDLLEGMDLADLSSEACVVSYESFSGQGWTKHTASIQGPNAITEFITFDDKVGENLKYAHENAVGVKIIWKKGEYKGKPQYQVGYVQLQLGDAKAEEPKVV